MGNKRYRDGGKRKAKKIIGRRYAAADKEEREDLAGVGYDGECQESLPDLAEAIRRLTEVFATLTEVLPCFSLSCKANARV